MERCCGVCKWAKQSELEAMVYCAFPVPVWLVNLELDYTNRDKALMDVTDGTDCPCFTEKED